MSFGIKDADWIEDPRRFEELTLCIDCKWLGDECPCGCGYGICGRDGQWVDMTTDTCEWGSER